LKDLDITKLKNISTKTNILMQQLLQELMLSYIVDIKEQTLLKQKDLISTYPTDLISSLKILSDLYLKIKDQNKCLKHKKFLEEYDNEFVF
jgi:hypothetical protein